MSKRKPIPLTEGKNVEIAAPVIEKEEKAKQELFQLSNGRYIMDEEQSRKMFIIKNREPEKSHQMSSTGYSWDESGMAELFGECYKNDTRYCAEAKCWYTYSEGAWRKDIGSLLIAGKIKEFYRLMALYCGEIDNEERRAAYMKFIVKMGDRRFRERLMKDATDVMLISAQEFDANPYLINCKNGTFDLEKMEFREHDWQDFLTMQTNFDYTLQDARCRRWEKFIAEVTCNDEDKADYLQKALGYSMLGMANEECMFILHGKTTRNGKSTMLETVKNLLGDYATDAPMGLICKTSKSKDAEAPSPVLASLKGKRFVTMQETEDSGRLDESAIKQYTGGESITARNLHEAPINFVPQFTMWLSCNDLPAVRDKSVFASERLRVIEFNRFFAPDEQDKNLKNEFQTPEAMKGIFAWLVAGYFKYKRFGLNMDTAMRSVVNQYRKDNDLVLQFLEQKCERTDEGEISSKQLYDVYKIWCKSNGFYVCSSKKFTAELNTHPEWYDGTRMRDGYRIYIGLKRKEI